MLRPAKPRKQFATKGSCSQTSSRLSPCPPTLGRLSKSFPNLSFFREPIVTRYPQGSVLWRDLHVEAPVDVQDVAGDITRFLRSQKFYSVRHIQNLPQASQRDARSQFLPRLRGH